MQLNQLSWQWQHFLYDLSPVTRTFFLWDIIGCSGRKFSWIINELTQCGRKETNPWIVAVAVFFCSEFKTPLVVLPPAGRERKSKDSIKCKYNTEKECVCPVGSFLMIVQLHCHCRLPRQVIYIEVLRRLVWLVVLEPAGTLNTPGRSMCAQ